MESERTFTLSLKDMMLLVSYATMAITDDDKERVMNWYAEQLEEKMGVTRKELEDVFAYLDLPLWDKQEEEDEESEEENSVEEPCGHCRFQTASMPNDMTDEGRLCADCYWDLDKAFKRRKIEGKATQ